MTLTEFETGELINALKKNASRPVLNEYMENGEGAYEASGGNFDDAYNLGIDDGETYLARYILTNYFGIEI